jgi:hypothetical protein
MADVLAPSCCAGTGQAEKDKLESGKMVCGVVGFGYNVGI